jgi:hypothetical protein
LFGEYLPLSFEIFFEEFFIASCVLWGVITYILVTIFLLNKMNLKLRAESTEIGMQVYRQNLYNAQETLKPEDFKKLVKLECSTGKYEVRLEKLEDIKNKRFNS